MKFIPIKTRILQPPKDNLLPILDSLSGIQEKDVILISSKVVAIHEGRCIEVEEGNKMELTESEADHLIHVPYRPFPLTIKYNTFLGASGIDESNGNGYYILLPKDCFVAAKAIHTYLRDRFKLKDLGVIITDSRSLPLRFGATGVALAWWGIKPLQSHIGKPDLFGRAFLYERSNIVDGMAAAANLVSGETDECTPIVIVRNVPDLEVAPGDTRDQLFSSPEEDTFRVMYKDLL